LISAVRAADGERREHGAEAVGEVVLGNAERYVEEVAALACLGREHQDPRARAKYSTQLRLIASTEMFTLEEFLAQLEDAADASDADGLTPYLEANAAERTNVLDALRVAVDRVDDPPAPARLAELREFLAAPGAASKRARLLAMDVLAAADGSAHGHAAATRAGRLDRQEDVGSGR
jgi:hypothetical protein